jgi:Ring finger domain
MNDPNDGKQVCENNIPNDPSHQAPNDEPIPASAHAPTHTEVPTIPQCAICWDTITASASHATPCGHIFHESCFQHILPQQNEIRCPTCRSVCHVLLAEEEDAEERAFPAHGNLMPMMPQMHELMFMAHLAEALQPLRNMVNQPQRQAPDNEPVDMDDEELPALIDVSDEAPGHPAPEDRALIGIPGYAALAARDVVQARHMTQRVLELSMQHHLPAGSMDLFMDIIHTLILQGTPPEHAPDIAIVTMLA